MRERPQTRCRTCGLARLSRAGYSEANEGSYRTDQNQWPARVSGLAANIRLEQTVDITVSTLDGFIAKSGIRTDRVRVHADHGDKSVQRAPVSQRGNSASRTVVSAISVGLRACRRAIGRTRPGSGCQLCLALGASLLA